MCQTPRVPDLDPFAPFGWVGCINMDRRPDRWTAFRERYAALGSRTPVVRVPGVEARVGNNPVFNGRAGCVLAHRAALRAGLASGAERFVVFEDDAAFDTRAGELIVKGYRELPAGWDLWHLGLFPRAPLVAHGPTTARVLHAFGNHATAYSRRGAEWLLERLPDAAGVGRWLSKHWALDKFFASEVQPRLAAFASCPVAVHQLEGFSDIEQAVLPPRGASVQVSTRPFWAWTGRRFLWRLAAPVRPLHRALRARHWRRALRTDPTDILARSNPEVTGERKS